MYTDKMRPLPMGMHMMKVALGLCVLCLIAACAPQQPTMSDDERCSNYGFTPGDNAFAQCMMQLDQQRRAIIGRMLLRH